MPMSSANLANDMTLAMLAGLGFNISASFCNSRYFRDMVEMSLFVERDTKIDASFHISDVFCVKIGNAPKIHLLSPPFPPLSSPAKYRPA